MKRFKPYAFSFYAGILFALGYPSIISDSLLITPILGMIILFYNILGTPELKNKIKHLLAFNFTFNLFGFYWITKTLVEFGELPYIVAGLISTLFTFIITPHLWIAILLIHYFDKKFKVQSFQKGLYAFSLSLILTACEYFSPQQFDVMLGQPFIILGKYLGLAPIFGLPIFSFVSYLLVFEVLNFKKYQQVSKFNLLIIFSFIILNPILKTQNETENLKDFSIRLVQANISNFLKLDSEKGGYASVSQVINRYRSLSLMKTKGIDLIIWPETAYPYAITTEENLESTPIPSVFSEIALTQNTNLLIGGYDHLKSAAEGSFYKTEFNTAFHINREGRLSEVYHKQILIPFGETLPLGPLNKYLSEYIDNISFFSEGEKFTLFHLDSGHKIISTICYELLKPEFVRKYLNNISERPHAMVNITNDSWYGKTMEPEQHLFLAKWRALEFNLPIIRSTNTGISSVIFSDGSESKRLGVFETGNLDLTLKLPQNPATFFQIYGFATILPLWIIGLIIHWLLIKLKYEN